MNASLSDILDVDLDDIDDDDDNYGLDLDERLSQLSERDRYTLCRRIVDRNMREYSEEQARKLHPEYSLERRLLQAVVDAALPYAISVNATVWDFVNDIVSKGMNVVVGLQTSLVERISETGDDAELNFWHHNDDPLSRIRAGDAPYLDREGIEAAASDYLELPYRVPQLERVLVDVLIALEVYAFADQMLTPLPSGLRWLQIGGSPITEKHALRKYIGGQILNAVILLGIAYGAATYLPQLIGRTPANWVAGIAVALFVLAFLIGTVALPFAWYSQSKARAKVRELINEMLRTYAEMRSDGMLSARRIREAASKAADAGVVWPGPLFAVLDDNIARSGTL